MKFGIPFAASAATALLLMTGAAHGQAATTATNTAKPEVVNFKAPVQIEVDGKRPGEGRYYPSPAVLDVDGDGTTDLVVADLFGKVTWVKVDPKTRSFVAEKAMLATNGKALKFDNW